MSHNQEHDFFDQHMGKFLQAPTFVGHGVQSGFQGQASFWKVTSEVSTHSGGDAAQQAISSASSSAAGQPQPPPPPQRMLAPEDALRGLSWEQSGQHQQQPSQASQAPVYQQSHYEEVASAPLQSANGAHRHPTEYAGGHAMGVAPLSPPPPPPRATASSRKPEEYGEPWQVASPPRQTAERHAWSPTAEQNYPVKVQEQEPVDFSQDQRISVSRVDKQLSSTSSSNWCGIWGPGGTCRGEVTQGQCMKCRMACDSYFDHHCPVCNATVCLTCLDDLRMILLSSYRCPNSKCGDQVANIEALRKSIWMINAYRSATRVVGGIGNSITSLFSEAANSAIEGSGSASSAQSNTGIQESRGRAQARGAPRGVQEVPSWSQPQLPSGSAQAGSAPQHGTRLPVNWAEVAGTCPASVRTGLAAPPAHCGGGAGGAVAGQRPPRPSAAAAPAANAWGGGAPAPPAPPLAPPRRSNGGQQRGDGGHQSSPQGSAFSTQLPS